MNMQSHFVRSALFHVAVDICASDGVDGILIVCRWTLSNTICHLASVQDGQPRWMLAGPPGKLLICSIVFC